MHHWRTAAIAALVSSVASAAVVVECDYRGAGRAARLAVIESAESYEFRLHDSEGIPLAESLELGTRGEFVDIAMTLPKTPTLCGSAGRPTSEVWCQSTKVPVVFTRANGQTLETTLETAGLDLAVQGGATPRRVAYRVFGSRYLDDLSELGVSQNGSFVGPVCKR